MRICFLAAVFALASASSANAADRPTAILVNPIHEAQIVHAYYGKDHVGIRTSRRQCLFRAGDAGERYCSRPRRKVVSRSPRECPCSPTQTLFTKTATPVVPAFVAVSIPTSICDVPAPPEATPGNGLRIRSPAPERRTLEFALMVGSLEVNAPKVAYQAPPSHSDQAAP